MQQDTEGYGGDDVHLVEDNPTVQPLAVIALGAQGVNFAEYLDDARLSAIGAECVEMYRLDKSSMQDWLDRMQRGIDLASLSKTEKNYPFAMAANVKYPLITTAALQFNARAYPAIVAADQVVRCKAFGADRNGAKAARGDRVAAHMSWQLLSKIEEWEGETDKMLVQLPIVGTVVRKVWYDPVEGRPRCRIIPPGAFIVNDKVKNLSDAPRITEELSLFPDEIRTRRLSGFYRDIDYLKNEGTDSKAPEAFIEQHCRLDLDDDEYDEPYIVTVHVASGCVARIVGDFEAGDVITDQTQAVVKINRGSYFIPYEFLPSMDGGFFGTGLGLLLGDISETINTIINMMMDAGHMASLGGGFIGSEFRIKGGSQVFKPGEWKLAGVKGGDIRSSIVPMTFPGPDGTLFQLLGLLIEAGKEVASVKDIMTGDTGTKNMTATTTLALIEQGMMVFTAAYKRIFRSLRAEFRLLAKINSTTVSAQEYNAFHDAVGPEGQPIQFDPAQEYAAADMDIMPVADPSAVTKMQQAAKAQIVMKMAEAGMVDPKEAVKRILDAASISDVQALIPEPKPDPMQQMMQQMGMEAAKADLTLKMVSVQQAMADIEETRSKTIKNTTDAAATAQTMKLDQMQAALEMARDGLAQLIAGRFGSVAGNPGGGMYPGGNIPVAQGPAGNGNSGLLGRPTLVRSGSAGFNQGAGAF